MAAKSKAARLFDLFGGVVALERATDLDKSVISRWDSKGKRGNGGVIPPQYNAVILEAARDVATKRAAIMDIPKVDWLGLVARCLEPNACPCCKRTLEAGMGLDKKISKTLRAAGLA